MFWLNFIFKTISILHSGKDPRHLAWGYALGAILGLTPFFCLHNAGVACLILLLDVNIGAAFFGMFVFKTFAYIFDPQFHDLGYYILVKIPSLKPFWTSLYNMPIAPWSRFYNTVVMGSLVVGLLMIVPNFFLFKAAVELYRKHLADRVEQLWIIKIINSNSMVNNAITWYNRIKLQ